jgi:nucleotidyltransferase substrate binding protein (TIGR01987 family)
MAGARESGGGAMERLYIRIASASKALTALREVVGIGDVSAITRDAAIQRFEFTFEAVWKAAKLYLKEIEGLDIGSPKGVLRASLEVGLLSENETSLGLEMVDDRNLTSHTYNEGLAVSIYERLDDYARLLSIWLKRMKERIEST